MKTVFVSITSQVARLIDVKSIVTLALVATLVVTTLNGMEVPALFSNSVMLVLGFFFGKTNSSSPSDVNWENQVQSGQSQSQNQGKNGKSDS